MDLSNDYKCKKRNCDNTKDKVEQCEKGPPSGRTTCTVPTVPPVLKNVGKLAAGVAGMSSGSATENTEELKCTCESNESDLEECSSRKVIQEVCNGLVTNQKCFAMNPNSQIDCSNNKYYENNCKSYSTCIQLSCTNSSKLKYTDLINKDGSCNISNTKQMEEFKCISHGYIDKNRNNQCGANLKEIDLFEEATSCVKSFKYNLKTNHVCNLFKTNDALESCKKNDIFKNMPARVGVSKNSISNIIDLFDTSNGFTNQSKDKQTIKFQTETNEMNHTESSSNNVDLFSKDRRFNSEHNNYKRNLEPIDIFNPDTMANYFKQDEILIKTTDIDSSRSAPLFSTNNKNISVTISDFQNTNHLPDLVDTEDDEKSLKHNPYFIKKRMIGINNCKCKIMLQNSKTSTKRETCKVFTTAALGVNTCNRIGNPRNKTALQPGHSLMDWIRLSHSGQDLTGVGPKAGTLSVSPKQLAEHNTENDAWIAIRGKVYNVTAYFDFHPGGKEELMKGVGQDATQMFNAVHPWVNYESILQKCLVGRLTNAEIDDEAFSLFYATSTQTIKVPRNFRFNLTPPAVNTNGGLSEENIVIPKFDWIQQLDNITTIFHTKPLSNPQVQVTAPTKENELDIIIIYNKHVFKNHLHFANNIHWPCNVTINWESGKVEVNFRKIASKIWDNYGTLEQKTEPISVDYEYEKIKYIVLNNIEENYNTRLIAFQRIDGVKQTVPIGMHLKVYGTIDDQELIRMYTPVPCCFMSQYSQDYEAYRGDVCLLIKSYAKGLLSPTICHSVKGDIFELSPPLGVVNIEKIACKSGYLLLAAGTGITPMLAIMKLILQSTKVKCEKLYILYFNQTEDDIILRKHFDNLAISDERVVVKYILSKPGKTWTGLTGHIDTNLLKTTIDEQCTNTQLFPVDIFSLICGPLVFANLAKSILLDIGYTDDNIHVFGS